MRNVSDKLCTGNQNRHFVLNKFFRKLCCFRDDVEKYSRLTQAIDNNTAHAHFMQDI